MAKFLDKSGLFRFWTKVKAYIDGKSGVTSFNGRTGAITPDSTDYTADMVGAVPTSRKINTKPLTGDITLTASDVSARPSTWTPSASDVGVNTSALLPSGGGTGQILSKKTAANYDTQWVDAPSGGGDYLPLSGGTVSGNLKVVGRVSLGNNSTASGDYSHSEGTSKATGAYSHAEGAISEASALYTHAEGYKSKASAESSHAEGYSSSASGRFSHAECSSSAFGEYAHSEGNATLAQGSCSHAEGYKSNASGDYSHAQGLDTQAYYLECAMGQYNKSTSGGYVDSSGNTIDYLMIGKGTSTSSRANIFRVSSSGIYGSTSFSGSGADYAEMFEWEDANPDAEDRCGRFVTLDGTKIRLAQSADEFILGIISGAPTIVGDVHNDQWQGMYLRDVFGRPIWEDVEVGEKLDSDGKVIIPARIEHREKVNPEYRNDERYIGRSDRPEWGVVGMLGKLVAIDDGTCVVNGWCKPSAGGVATRSDEQTKFRVMERIDKTHIRVLIL